MVASSLACSGVCVCVYDAIWCVEPRFVFCCLAIFRLSRTTSNDFMMWSFCYFSFRVSVRLNCSTRYNNSNEWIYIKSLLFSKCVCIKWMRLCEYASRTNTLFLFIFSVFFHTDWIKSKFYLKEYYATLVRITFEKEENGLWMFCLIGIDFM